MRVSDKSPLVGTSADRAKEPGRSGTVFQVSAQPFAPVKGAKVAPVFSAVPLDAVLALQGESDQPVERRRRQVKRGLLMVDGLDRLKVGLLSGVINQNDLDDLARLLAEKRGQDVPQDVDDMLEAVDVRVAVELAKLGR